MKTIPRGLVVVDGCLMNSEVAARDGDYQNDDCRERGWVIRRSAKDIFEMRRREAMRRHNTRRDDA